MKKIILIGCLIVFSCCYSYSQYMSVFGESETQWTIKSSNLHGIITDTLTAKNDTIINDVSFRIISSSDPWHTIYLHEDLAEGRWSYFTDIEPTERLLMDLSLNVGDSFYVRKPWGSEQGYFEVDSVYEKDQRKHIQINLPLYFANNEKLTFIEGIGPNTGLSYQDTIDLTNATPYLLCYWRDGIQEFSNIYHDGKCSISSFTNIDSPKHPSPFFNISPNPVTQNYFEISFDEPFTGIISLMDINGGLVFKKTITESLLRKTILLPYVSQTGVFLLRVQNENGKRQSKKIIIIR